VYKLAFDNKMIAAQVFLVTLEWECDYTGRFSTTSYKAMEAMLSLARKWGWTNATDLHAFEREKKGWNRALYFRLTKNGLMAIYELAGPLLDKKKDAKVRHMLYGTGKTRAAKKRGVTKQKILWLIKNEKGRKWSVIELAMRLGLHPRTVQRHLSGDQKKRMKGLVESGFVKEVGKGRNTCYVSV